MKKVGKRQRYYSTKAEFGEIIEVFRERRQENRRENKRREARSRKYKRMRGTFLNKKERSKEGINWEAIKANQKSKKYNAWQSQEMIEILSARVSKKELREIIEQSMTNEKCYTREMSKWGPRKKTSKMLG